MIKIRKHIPELESKIIFNSSAGPGSGPWGSWMALPANFDISKLKPEEIKELLSLDFIPKYATDIKLPAGTSVTKSKTSIVFDGKGLTTQYRIKMDDLKPDFLSAPREL